MPANNVLCPHCGKRLRLEISKEESQIICLVCGEMIHRDSFQPSAEFAEEVDCEENEIDELPKKKRRYKPSNSKRRSKRLLIAGAPPWASNNGIYIVSMNASTDRESHYAPIFEKIGQTFRMIRRQDRD